jgi:7-alpha-hydroxysteroid dehydrogenase
VVAQQQEVDGNMILDNFRLEDKVAIVTGAGRGVGKGIATALGEAGATVVCAARTQSEIDSTVEAIQKAGGRALAVNCDVTNLAQVQKMIDTVVARESGIDIVVNNAGGGGHCPTEKLRDDFVIETMRLNFLSVLNICRLATPSLRERGGNILNISSGMAHVAEANCIAYAAAKAALEQASRNLAYELAPDIRVNTLRLGAIQTPDFDKLIAAHPGVEDGLSAWTPVKRIGRPQDVAASALYLCSAAGEFITGQIMDVDGGIMIPRGALAIMSGP